MSDERARPGGDASPFAGTGPLRIGPFEVRTLLGAGGMGEVYLAHDSKLGRDVAIKVLRGSSPGDPQQVAQFEGEARLLAALSHPNIAVIYGIEELPTEPAAGARGIALVMELVPGETLAQRIKRGALPLDEALDIGRQVADALDAAHGAGIVHCDLKPANIKIRPDGAIKVLDFGLARFVRPSASPRRGDETTTIATGGGDIVGTPRYMSPEQARGQALDRRTDIWSFGCVLYEMLAGETAFAGATVTDVLGAVVGAEPDLGRVPTQVRPLLRRCLVKDARRRLRDIGDAMPLIEAASGSESERPTSPGAGRAARMGWLAFGLVSAAALALAVLHFRGGAGPPAPMHFQVAMSSADRSQFLLAPDGRSLLMSLRNPEGARLVSRSLESGELRELPGTSEPGRSCWSPDGKYIAFASNGALKKIAASGGPPEVLVGHGVLGAGCWANGGIVVLDLAGGVSRVPERGGEATVLTTVDQSRGEIHHESPSCLPDGRFLYYRHLQERGASGIYAGAPNLPPEKQSLTPVLVADDGPVLVPASEGAPDQLLFMQGDTLYAQPFSLDRLEVSGAPTKIADKVASSGGNTEFTAAGSGALLYRRAEDSRRQLTFFDRMGKVAGTLCEPNPAIRGLRIAPDGTRAALVQFPRDGRVNNDDIWLVPFDQSAASRLTANLTAEITPQWSEDGSRIAYTSNRGGSWAVYQTSISGSTPDLLSPAMRTAPLLTDWSRDGRFLLMTVVGSATRRDIAVLPVTSGGGSARLTPIPLAQTDFDDTAAVFSPDGRWIAYVSDESGQNEVYVRAFDVARDGALSSPESTRRRISNGARGTVRWRRDGREILYVGADGAVMSVEVSVSPSLSARAPRDLFSLPSEAARLVSLLMDITPDGSRFLVAMPPREARSNLLEVLLNWR